MRLNPRLAFNGQCEAAFQLYEKLFAGEITLLLTYGNSPTASSFPGLEDKIAHATLKVGDQVLTGADVPPGSYEKPQGFAIQLNIDNPDEAQRIFNTLAEGGTIHLPLQQTFWAERYGMATDRFGTPWEDQLRKSLLKRDNHQVNALRPPIAQS
jgi:PhnB protein